MPAYARSQIVPPDEVGVYHRMQGRGVSAGEDHGAGPTSEAGRRRSWQPVRRIRGGSKPPRP